MRRMLVQVREVWFKSVVVVDVEDDQGEKEAIAKVEAGRGITLSGNEYSHTLPAHPTWSAEEIDNASLPQSVREQLDAGKGEDPPGTGVVFRPSDVRRLAKRTTD